MRTTPTGKTRELSGDGPLWSLPRRDLEDRLAAGDFGEAFPGELALAAGSGDSRRCYR